MPGHQYSVEPKPLRGKDQPTEYEQAAVRLDAEELRRWVVSHFRSRYVPEAVLDEYGLKPEGLQ
jgi:hypothetical protein